MTKQEIVANRVAVWIPVYNEENFLEKTIQSVRAQTHKAITLIISENHSTDRSLAIIQSLQNTETEIILWRPETHCPSLEHMDFIWEKLRLLDFDFFIHIGGHDLMATDYVEKLVAAWHRHPQACVIAGAGIALKKDGTVLGEYTRKTPTLIGPQRIFNPYSVITLTSSNVAIHGLIPGNILRKASFRYRCPGADVLFIAEISTLGDLIYEKDALIYQRISGADTSGYLEKHMGVSKKDPEVMTELMSLQLRYLRDITYSACDGFPQEFINMYLSSLASVYFIKWCSVDYYAGNLNPLGDIASTLIASSANTGDILNSMLITE